MPNAMLASRIEVREAATPTEPIDLVAGGRGRRGSGQCGKPVGACLAHRGDVGARHAAFSSR